MEIRRELVESSSPFHFDVSTASVDCNQLGKLAQQVHLPSEPSSQPYFSLIPNLILYRILCLTATVPVNFQYASTCSCSSAGLERPPVFTASY